MKLHNVLGTTLASTLFLPALSSAQVISVSFGEPQAVPLSPWLTAFMAAMLALAAVAFLRKHHRSGMFMLVLSVVAGGAAVRSSDSVAGVTIPPLNLVTSPAIFDYTGIGSSCSKSISVVASTKTVIKSIQVSNSVDVRPGDAKTAADLGWIIEPTSTCKVGTPLAASGQCTIDLTGAC